VCLFSDSIAAPSHDSEVLSAAGGPFIDLLPSLIYAASSNRLYWPHIDLPIPVCFFLFFAFPKDLICASPLPPEAAPRCCFCPSFAGVTSFVPPLLELCWIPFRCERRPFRPAYLDVTSPPPQLLPFFASYFPPLSDSGYSSLAAW